MADTEVVDPTDQKAEDILESLGLHPAQLKVQDHLASMHDQGGASAPAPAGVPRAETPAEPPKLAAPLPSPNNPPPIKRPSMFSDAENKFSQKHHFWGGVLQGLDVAGSVIAPGVMQNIPGTMLNQKVKDASINNTRKAATEQAQADATLKKTNAETQALEDKPGVKPTFEKTEGGNIIAITEDPTTGKPKAEVIYKGTGDAKDAFSLWQQQHPGEPVENFLKLQKPEKENDFGKFYDDWLKDNNAPDNAHNRLMARKEYAAAGQAPQHEPRQMAIGPDGTVIELRPGVKVPQGTKTVAGDLTNKPNADEQKRADLVNNLNENLDTLEEIVNRRPDLFGKVAGRATKFREWLGSDDPDVAALKGIEDRLGMVAQSSHGMRSAQHVEASANSVLNGFKNGADATKRAILDARKSGQTFTDDAARARGEKPETQAPKTITYSSNGKTYNIPAEQEAEFLKDHPQAKKQ